MSPLPPPPPTRTPAPTNVVVISKIPEGVTEQQIASAGGRYSEVLQVSYRVADLDGPGWAIIAFASPELAKVARERLDGKALTGTSSALLEAALGEGLYGNIRGASDQDSPWKEARTPQGQVYYFHSITRQSVWTKPPPEFLPQASPGIPPPPGARPPVPFSGARPATVPPPNPGAQAQMAIQTAQATVAAAQDAPAEAPPAATPLNAGPVGANLFIYHIPNSWDDTILRQHFEHFGKIVSCRVQKDGDGRPRGFGFVSFDTPPSAQAAIAGMHGFPVEGKHLKVQLKKGDEAHLAPNPAASLPPQPVGGLLDITGALPPPPPSIPLGGMPPAGMPPPGSLPPPGGLPPPGSLTLPGLMGAPTFAPQRPPPMMPRPGPY